MENKPKKGKLWHRIKYRNSIAPTVEPFSSDNLRHFDMNLKKRLHLMQYMNKIVKKTKAEERSVKVAPLHHIPSKSLDNDIREFCRNCPSTAMSRFQERDILKKVAAQGLENNYPILLKNIIAEARDDFLKITQQSGMEMKLATIDKQFPITHYKHLGRTENYPNFLQKRSELKNKFILHHPLIRRILNECVTKLPYTLLNLNTALKNQLDAKEFQKQIFDYANDAAQILQEFYRKIVVLVEHDKGNTQRAKSYLGACTGLLSVNISKTIAHTLLHVATFTASKEHIPYLKLNITFKDRLILEPTADDIIEIYKQFLKKVINNAKQFYVLEKYKFKGYDNKQIHLCLTDEFFDSVLAQISRNIKEKYEPILEYIKNLDDEFADIYEDLSSRGNTISTSDLVFEDGCQKILHYKSYLPKVAFIPDNGYFTIGQLIITEYREVIKQTLLNIIDNIFNNLSAQHEWENNDICEAFDIIYVRATQKPITTEEVIEIGKYMGWVRSDYLSELKERVIKALAYLTKLIQLGPLKENHIIINARAINWLDEILPILEENNTTYEQLKFEAEEKLQRVIEEINVDIKDVYPLLEILDSMDNIENVKQYLNTITLHMVKIKNIENKIDWINREEVSLSFPKSSYAEFEELKNYVYPFFHLLKLCLDVQRNLSVWLDGQFDLINYEKVKETVEKYYKDLMKTQKVYRNKLRQAQDENLSLRFKGTVDDPDMLNWPAPLKLCSKAIKLIQDFEPSLAVIKIMCNEALMKRHWQKMSKVAGFDITPNAGTTLRKIIQIDLKPDIDKYDLISFSATKERELLENLKKMQKEWIDVNFTTGAHKDIKIITQLEDIEIVADDHIIKVINMLSSIYVKPYDNQVRDFYNKLLKITKTVQEIRQAQHEWLHLFPLFLCKEITNKMPEEAAIFHQITDTYTNYIEMIIAQPNVHATVTSTNILQDLIHCNLQFEVINKGVDHYFSKIRDFFPRFYFVSNEEMFRILSLTTDPTKIQRFIKSIFYEIKNLLLDENFTISGITSENNEVLLLTQTIITKDFHGCVEKWLKELEKQISDSIQLMIREALDTHADENWMLKWPCQILLAVTQILFTLEGHKAIKNNTLQIYSTQIQQNLSNIINFIKTHELSNCTIANIRSLLVVTVNNKNIIDNLISSEVINDHDFKWASQLRYYTSNGGSCIVKILDNTFNYGNEYLGNGTQIVTTPLTEKYFYTLIMAYKYHLCGCCQGLPGTGKTETVKGLAKALAVHCTFFNCSAPMRFKTIIEFLKGVVSKGSWLCLEEFDKIQMEVYSILSEEISKISTALRSGAKTITLNASELKLHKCFICCNLQSSKPLPESLKILFRPVTMAVPDAQIITQVTLFSFGYQFAKELGNKIITIHQLMDDLIPLSNIDFGIRTIKEILTKCASVSPDANEEQVVYNAICYITYQKLPQNEIHIFDNILKQFFPSNQPEILTSNFENNIITACHNLNLESNKDFLMKVTELYETIKRKVGVVIMGQALTGKSTSINVLKTVLDDEKITIKNLSPKALTVTQLYGGIDTNSRQWSDGIITKYLREFSHDKDWIIFDGPIDSLWVDDLNSVLDDKRKLCLSSGEILHLKEHKSLIFETDNLKKISPGMISRCGIVYMDSKVIGWRPLVASWLKYSDFEWHKGYEENFTTLFDWVIPPCLLFIKLQCQQLCKVNEFSLVKTTIQILEMLLIEAYDAIQKKEEDIKNLSSWIQASFIQAVIWGIDSSLDFNSRLKFDEFFKQLWKGQNKTHPYPKTLEKVEVSVPAEGMIFDHSYFYKSKGTWKFWPDVLKNEKVEESDYLTDVFVPTNETVKYSTLIKMHINFNYPILLVGPPGTGKTSCMQDMITNKLDKEMYEPTVLTFTANLTANQIQEMILTKLFKKKSGRYGPTEGKTCILYIDDFNMPNKDEFGTQPALELMRQLLDHKNFFNLENFKPLYIDHINVIATMDSNLGYQKVCQRLLRHFNIFSINELPEESIQRIFSNVLLTRWKKAGFPSDIIGTINQIVAATYHFYKAVSDLKPTLSWNFYYFNMRNFSKVIQVCAMIKKESADTNKKLFFKLWTHEIIRVLSDRLLEKDKEWFFENVKSCIVEYFKEDIDHLFENLPKNLQTFAPKLSKLLFGTYLDKTSGRFDEADIEKLQEIAINSLKDYNKDNLNKIDLVLFDQALEHLSKICRILSIPCCNLIQVGMCGTGRQSLVRLACIIYDQKFFNLEITENYNSAEWRKTVKSFLKEAGGYGKHCTFFLKEDQIVNGNILDDIDYLLKTGQIPFLYSLDEKQEILDLVRISMQDENPNIDGGSESIFLYHQKRCRENLHIIISFNPINSFFKKCLKAYPSLRDFCEVNYLKKWSGEALKSIAKAWIADLDMMYDTKQRIVNSFSYFHTEVENISSYVHITIGSYLEFIRLYVDLVVFKQKKIKEIKNTYLAALEKLSFAAFQISEMQKSLADYQPQLEAMTVQAVEMAKQIEKETEEVEKASNLVKKDEEIANEQAAAAQVLKLDCEADLAQAIPILEDAISALNTLKPTDITLVKSMKNPPDAIKLVMAAVCVIKDVKPDRIPDPSTGRKTIDYWGPSKRILGDMNFLQTLKDFDKDNIKPEIMVKIRKDYLPHKDFKPHTVAKASSAAEGLCKWIIAMDMYDKVAKEVAPKKEKLEKAEREYGTTMAILNEKKEQVTRIEQKLADLNLLLEDATRKQQKLQRNVDICKRKLNRAQKLIGGLSEEKIRWTNAVDQLQNQYDCLPGDILLSSAIISYLGSFKNEDRRNILKIWFDYVRSNDIPSKESYDFVAAFEKDVDFDKWHLNGLPTDRFFVENGIIGRFSKRWSLFIDPQNQANSWIKTSEKQNGIRVTKFSCPNYLSVIKESIIAGNPLLLENVEETIKPFLVNLITRTTFYKNGNTYIKLGGETIPYNQQFLLYMTTNLKYPKYSPEMYDKITVIDFSLSRDSLEEHLLTCVVEVEKPTLKKVKKTLNTERKKNKDALNNIEEKILKILSESTTDILEDENALQILDESKILSREIQQKQEASIHVEESLNKFRAGYENVAKHATILYFTTFELSKINHMYQFSYNWFIETFSEAIQNAEKFKDLPRRRTSLVNTLSYELYCKISRSIFEKDKLFFAFLLCINLLISSGKITKDEIHFFTAPCTNNQEVPSKPEWLPPESWKKICNFSKLTNYENFQNFFLDNELHFKNIFDSATPEEEQFLEPFNSNFIKLLITTLIRSDRLYAAVLHFISQELGEKFVRPPLFDICISYTESHILSPLIFILSLGSDPINSLHHFAKIKHFQNKLVLVSIRNGEENDLECLIDNGKKLGLWICLQNCHLLTKWLPYLDLKLEEMDYSNTHENFRLWLTTNETTAFPISLLERSVKVTKEPPKGLRNKLVNLFLDDPINSPKFYANCPGKHDLFIRLLYSLAFCHCILQERRNFGSYGWNVSYEFKESDFFMSIHELQWIVNNSFNPLEELTFLVEKCSYGGYISDKLDTRLFKVILLDYLNPKLLNNNSYTFNNLHNYGLPIKTDHQDYVKHILNLPATDDTQIFGLHHNYDKIKGWKESKLILKSIQTTFNKLENNNVTNNVPTVTRDLLSRLTSELMIQEEDKKSDDPIINLIIIQEMKSYNKLLKLIRLSLQRLQEVVDGSALMTDELDELCNAVIRNKVPRLWSKKSYMNSYNLSRFIEDFSERIEYFKNFYHQNSVQNIWLASFFRPKAFLTANKILYSKKSSVPIDQISFKFKTLKEEINKDEEGILVNGLYLIGGSWNEEDNILDELLPKILQNAIPPILFVFVVNEDFNCLYDCPLYKSINNFHHNSLLENSSNFIMFVLISSRKCSEYWIKRGTALLSQV